MPGKFICTLIIKKLNNGFGVLVGVKRKPILYKKTILVYYDERLFNVYLVTVDNVFNVDVVDFLEWVKKFGINCDRFFIND